MSVTAFEDSKTIPRDGFSDAIREKFKLVTTILIFHLT